MVGPGGASPDTNKSPQAFRTITEVAGDLDVAQHVLRFWETKFPQVKPVKRGGGRRYYRPEDVQLLKHIRDLLYVDGYTIKGVQKILRKGTGALEEEAAKSAARADDWKDEVRVAIRELEGLKGALKNL
jgi:DNA-binding transcriptional MerR regulator